MKKIFTFISLMTLVSGSILAVDSDKTAWTPGSDWYKEIDSSFKQGKDKEFLEKVESLYQAKYAGTEAQIKKEFDLPQVKKRLAEIKKQVDEFQIDTIALQDRTNKELEQVAKDNPNLEVSKVIQDALVNSKLSPEQIKGLEFVNELPLSTESDDEKYRNIAIEYELKKQLIYMSFKGQIAELGNLNREEMRKYVAMLELEKLQKLKELASKEKDQPKEELLDAALKGFPLESANNHDYQYFLLLSNGARAPANDAEKKVIEILKSYEKQRQELIKKYGLDAKSLSKSNESEKVK
jgi:hypothetical protein